MSTPVFIAENTKPSLVEGPAEWTIYEWLSHRLKSRHCPWPIFYGYTHGHWQERCGGWWEVGEKRCLLSPPSNRRMYSNSLCLFVSSTLFYASPHPATTLMRVMWPALALRALGLGCHGSVLATRPWPSAFAELFWNQHLQEHPALRKSGVFCRHETSCFFSFFLSFKL